MFGNIIKKGWKYNSVWKYISEKNVEKELSDHEAIWLCQLTSFAKALQNIAVFYDHLAGSENPEKYFLRLEKKLALFPNN